MKMTFAPGVYLGKDHDQEQSYRSKAMDPKPEDTDS